MTKVGFVVMTIFFILGILEILHIRAFYYNKSFKEFWKSYKESFKLPKKEDDSNVK